MCVFTCARAVVRACTRPMCVCEWWVVWACTGVHVHGRVASHVLHGDVLEDLAVVHVPDRLVVPDLGRQQDGPQHDALPVGGADVDLRVRQQPLQIYLGGGGSKLSVPYLAQYEPFHYAGHLTLQI